MIIEWLLGLHKTEKYTEEIRKFALTLRYYSPRAYNFVRNKFNCNLPHPSTIRKWYQQSDVSCETGICKRSIKLLQEKVIEMRNEGKELFCGLVHDEISIRQHVQWLDSKKNFSGFITYGKIPEDSENLPLATQVLVYLLNGINIPFNLPIAHYFIANLEGVDKVILMHSISKALAETGVHLLSSTFDGFSTNVTSCEIMGCSFDLNDFQPQIENPSDLSQIHIFFDPPHMLKLIRGTLGSYKTIYDRTGRAIEWKYFERLVDIRDKEYFVTHKMTRAHIEYHRNPMKVLLATQTFSNSTAVSLQSLSQRKTPGFEEAAATSELAARLDKLFDILNSDTQRPDNKYKSPITPETCAEILSFLDDMTDYIKGLTKIPFKEPLIKSEKKMGFKGMLVNIENLKMIYKNFVGTERLPEFAVRRICQCPLESLFGRIRSFSMLGCNTNPTVSQFQAAFRKILVNNEVTSSEFANCKDQLDVLHLSSADRPNTTNATFMNEIRPLSDTFHADQSPIQSQDNDVSAMNAPAEIGDVFEHLEDIPTNADIGLAYLAGKIDKKILGSEINCPLCANILNENQLLNIDAFPLSRSRDSKVPCTDTYLICKTAYEILESHKLKIDFKYIVILDDILSKVNHESIFNNSDFSDHPTHKFYFVKHIVETYIRMWAVLVARKATLDNHLKNVQSRQSKAQKVRHFQGC